jgi:hypothetical protein
MNSRDHDRAVSGHSDAKIQESEIIGMEHGAWGMEHRENLKSFTLCSLPTELLTPGFSSPDVS